MNLQKGNAVVVLPRQKKVSASKSLPFWLMRCILVVSCIKKTNDQLLKEDVGIGQPIFFVLETRMSWLLESCAIRRVGEQGVRVRARGTTLHPPVNHPLHSRI